MSAGEPWSGLLSSTWKCFEILREARWAATASGFSREESRFVSYAKSMDEEWVISIWGDESG